MASTVTEVQTLKAVLDDANPNKIADALQKTKLGTMFDLVDTGDVTQGAATTMVLPNNDSALLVQCVELVTNVGNAGIYQVGPYDSTPINASAAGKADGMVTLSQDGTTLTASANVTVWRAIYIRRPGNSSTTLSAEFA
jgi:hypothetical protein